MPGFDVQVYSSKDIYCRRWLLRISMSLQVRMNVRLRMKLVSMNRSDHIASMSYPVKISSKSVKSAHSKLLLKIPKHEL